MTIELWDISRFLGRWPTSDLAYHDLDGLVADLDRLGIGRAAVCHTSAWQYDPALGNAALVDALAAASPAVRDRLLPCWAVVPFATGEQGSPAELAADMDRHGVSVARLFPRDHNYSLTGPDAAAMLGFLAGRATVTLVDLDQTSWEEIDGVAGDRPDLPLVVCRVGYRGIRRMAGVLERHANVHVDLSYFGSHEGIEWIVERFGAGRLLFGTGAPLADGGGAVTRLMLSGVSPDDRAAIGQGNLGRLLGEADGPLTPPAPLPPAAAGGRGENAPAVQVRRGEPIRDWDVVDAHAHIGRWYNFFTPGTDPAAMVAVMDRCGVRKAVVSGLLGVGPDGAGGNVEVVELVRRYPERFAGYALLNPHHPDSPADVDRTLDVPGVVGIKIHPETHAYPVTGSGYSPAWEIAARRGVPVLTHTESGSPYCDPAMFRVVAERWPQVRIILGHAGVTEAGHRAAIAVARDHPNLILELCGSLMTGQWIRRLIEAVGPDRVLFGSDFPFIDLRYGLGRVVFAGLSSEELRLVLGGNARRLLKV